MTELMNDFVAMAGRAIARDICTCALLWMDVARRVYFIPLRFWETIHQLNHLTTQPVGIYSWIMVKISVILWSGRDGSMVAHKCRYLCRYKLCSIWWCKYRRRKCRQALLSSLPVSYCANISQPEFGKAFSQDFVGYRAGVNGFVQLFRPGVASGRSVLAFLPHEPLPWRFVRLPPPRVVRTASPYPVFPQSTSVYTTNKHGKDAPYHRL